MFLGKLHTHKGLALLFFFTGSTGSSTACLGILDKENGQLETLNLGDSGFCIFRNGQTFYKSKEQYHDLNVPFQVGVKEIVDGKAIPHGNR